MTPQQVSGGRVRVIGRAELSRSWSWLLNSLPDRPSAGPSYVHDELQAWHDTIGRLLHQGQGATTPLATLYLVSTFGRHESLIEFLNGGSAFDVHVPTTTIDPSLRALYQSARRFRASLAEHLGFWIPLASNRKRSPNALLAASKPHTLPEDTGPDSLVIEARPSRRMELISVKNSTQNPRPMIASGRFRSHGRARPGPCLDEFALLIGTRVGFSKILNLVATTCNYAGVSLLERMQVGLIGRADYHAFVVASHQYCAPDIFDGFSRVSNSPGRRIGTYVGADNWMNVAARVRRQVVSQIQSAGAW